MTGADSEAAVHDPFVADYLERVAARLPGGARRRDVLDELEDGLRETLGAHRLRGLASHEAARAAITEFGTPERVAAAHAAEIIVRQVRRHAWGVLAALIVTGFAWQLYAHAAGDLTPAIPPSGWARPAFLALVTSMPVVPMVTQVLALALAIAGARLIPGRTAGRAWLHALTMTLAVVTTVTLANGAAIVALMSASHSPPFGGHVTVVLLLGLIVSCAHSLVAVHRVRTLPRPTGR